MINWRKSQSHKYDFETFLRVRVRVRVWVNPKKSLLFSGRISHAFSQQPNEPNPKILKSYGINFIWKTLYFFKQFLICTLEADTHGQQTAEQTAEQTAQGLKTKDIKRQTN